MESRDTSIVLKSILKRCLSIADSSTLSSMRSAVEELTGAIIILQHSYHLGEEEAILFENQNGSVYEIFYNPDFQQDSFSSRLNIAHELFHVLATCPTSDVPEILHLCSHENYDEESLADGFSAMVELIRPKVTTRKIKTPSQLQVLEDQMSAKNFDAGNIFATMLDGNRSSFSFQPPLKCEHCDADITNSFFHKDHHNIAIDNILP